MNELTTIQAVLYGVSGVLLYCLGMVVGKILSDLHYDGYIGQKNPNLEHDFNTYQWTVRKPVVTDQYGHVLYVRRPLK